TTSPNDDRVRCASRVTSAAVATTTMALEPLPRTGPRAPIQPVSSHEAMRAVTGRRWRRLVASDHSDSCAGGETGWESVGPLPAGRLGRLGGAARSRATETGAT